MKARLPATAIIAFLLVALAGAPAFADAVLFRRGDSNADSRVDLSDAVYGLSFLFAGEARPPCRDALDTNDDGAVDLSDPIQILGFLFLGGERPAGPSLFCGSDPTGDELDCEAFPPCAPSGQLLQPRLQAAGGCEEVLAAMKARLTEKMGERLEQNRAIVLQMAVTGGCGWRWFDDWGCPVCGVVLLGGDPVPPPSPPEDGEEASEYSETNNQVEGVDEADFVKNDGGFIYILADGRFQIIDAWPAVESRRIASVEVAGIPRKLFVHADRALIYSSLEPLQPEVQDPWGPWSYWMSSWMGGGTDECTYGYDCEFTGDGRKCKITVLDIADREHPSLLREIEFTGSLLGARRIGDVVHTALIHPESIVPGVEYWPAELADLWTLCETGVFPYTVDQVNAMFDALLAANVERIEAATEADFLPSYRETRWAGGVPDVREVLLQDCESFLVSPSADGTSLLSLVSLEIDAIGDIAASTVVGRPGAVYASADSFYVATRHGSAPGGPWYFDDPSISEATTVHRFEISGVAPASSYIGSGVVKGRILNQFSMDEHAGYLRIATTTGRLPSPDVHSTVSVLGTEGYAIGIVGQIDGIAPGEDIRSVRFDGERGFIVTFKKTDPLFVLDLTDPFNPAIRGELKIPGFSTYLHLLDEDHVLSIGFDAADQGDFAWFQGILLQVFDVSDPASPSLLHREVIGTRGSTSDAATDHLAFNYFRPRGLLAIPMVVCEGTTGGPQMGDTMSFNGLMVYRVDLGEGFRYLGGVPHTLPEGSTVSCGSWWTDGNSQVKRSIFMDDWVYSIALDRIEVAPLEDLAHPGAEIMLEE